ncbi:MAG: DUF1127 domain-containing protein [Pseudomonadota bacterium]
MSLQEKAPHSATGIPLIRTDDTGWDISDPVDHIAMWLRHASALIEAWWRIARQRRALARLDDRMLRDVGLTREQVDREVMRPFWDI